MKNHQIPHPQWKDFCERFSLSHHGWHVSVSVAVVSSATADGHEPPLEQWLIEDQPLQEVREERSDEQDEIIITVGENRDEISILVQDVAAVFEQTEANREFGLRIDSAHSNSTLIHFNPPADPLQLDGLAESET